MDTPTRQNKDAEGCESESENVLSPKSRSIGIANRLWSYYDVRWSWPPLFMWTCDQVRWGMGRGAMKYMTGCQEQWDVWKVKGHDHLERFSYPAHTCWWWAAVNGHHPVTATSRMQATFLPRGPPITSVSADDARFTSNIDNTIQLVSHVPFALDSSDRGNIWA
jgi:hypothetical protein